MTNTTYWWRIIPNFILYGRDAKFGHWNYVTFEYSNSINPARLFLDFPPAVYFSEAYAAGTLAALLL